MDGRRARTMVCPEAAFALTLHGFARLLVREWFPPHLKPWRRMAISFVPVPLQLRSGEGWWTGYVVSSLSGKVESVMEQKGKPETNSIPLAPPSIPGEMLARILDSLDGIVYVADLETQEILFANSYLKKLFGFDPTGRKCWQLIHVDQGGGCRFCERHNLLDEAGEPRGVIYREYQNPFNKKWYGAKDQAIRWTDGRYVRLEIALDITEHKKLQNFLQEARRQAENAIHTKNRFVALVAHDLKSPFVSILGMLQRILRKESFAYEIHRTFLENIINNGQRMLKMIDNLLDMDRLETGKIRPEPIHFDVSEMVMEVFENYAHLAKKKRLQLENLVPCATEIFADRYLYLVVLNNLVSNAVKFSFADGVISISFDDTPQRQRLIVRDQGMGITPEFVKDIFRPDVKTSTPGTEGETGTGLGLVFCQQIMRAHGGRIDLESERGVGTTFYIELGPSCRLPDREKKTNPPE